MACSRVPRSRTVERKSQKPRQARVATRRPRGLQRFLARRLESRGGVAGLCDQRSFRKVSDKHLPTYKPSVEGRSRNKTTGAWSRKAASEVNFEGLNGKHPSGSYSTCCSMPRNYVAGCWRMAASAWSRDASAGDCAE